MALFVTVHARYHDVQWGLFKDTTPLAVYTVSSKHVSAQLLEQLGATCADHSIRLSDLSAFLVHQGPAPFATLRVCLATVNGIAYATGLPLVGINGLHTLLRDYSDRSVPTIVLLNAFAQELYYGIDDPTTKQRSYGYEHHSTLIPSLAKRFTGPIRMLGNGCTLYQEELLQACKDRAQYIDQNLMSLDELVHEGIHRWDKGDTAQQLMPIYMKAHSTKTNIQIKRP